MIDILYEDNHLIAVNKPAGLLTQPTNIEQDSLETRVKAWIKEKYQKPGNVFLGVVHRLDRPASGVVLFAKTSKALSRLNEAIKSQQCEKVYHAIVEGIPDRPQSHLEHFLYHGDYRAIICSSNHPEGKKAILDYRVLETGNGKALIEIQLETGRYHQIRAQLSASGHPILGDSKYGSHEAYEDGSIALHHLRMTIEHPVTKQLMSFESSPPFKLT